MRAWLWLLLLLPLAAAEPTTVIEDPAGDASADPDVLAVDIELDGAAANITIELATWTAGRMGEVDLTWRSSSVSGESQELGVRFRALPTGLEVYRLSREGPVWDESLGREAGQISGGSPATWSVQGIVVGTRAGDVLDGFAVASYTSTQATPGGLPRLTAESARGPAVDQGEGTSELVLELFPLAEAPWQTSGRGRDGGPGAGPAHIERFSIDRDGQDFLLTWRLASWSVEEVVACGTWGVDVFAYPRGTDQSLSSSVTLDIDNPVTPVRTTAVTRDWDHDGITGSHDHIHEVQVVPGAPAWVQVRISDTDWHRGEVDLDDLGVQARCGEERHRMDPAQRSSFGFVEGGWHPSVLVMFAPGIIALVWFVWLHKTTKP